MTPTPRLTVATVTYNAVNALAPTVASVVRQSARNRFEYIIVDGFSMDGSIDLIKDFFDAKLVDYWISSPDAGIYDAMNRVIELARGEYILFLNAGDEFAEADTVEKFLDWQGDKPDYVWGDCLIKSQGKLVSDPANNMLRHIYRQMTVSHQSIAIRKALLKEHNFRRYYKVAADYEVLCHLITSGRRGLYRPIPVALIEEEGFSSRNFYRGLREKRMISYHYFPQDRWRSGPYFFTWGIYMKVKVALQTMVKSWRDYLKEVYGAENTSGVSKGLKRS
ncbi:MAG: glycosyltransferase [Spirochaetales bacterium]|nr:glycosyltransferase [Spirochaetales bacterium]